LQQHESAVVSTDDEDETITSAPAAATTLTSIAHRDGRRRFTDVAVYSMVKPYRMHQTKTIATDDLERGVSVRLCLLVCPSTSAVVTPFAFTAERIKFLFAMEVLSTQGALY